jgi:hypothetical protein
MGALSLQASLALADGPVIPDYPQTDCSGPACATIARSNSDERVSVYYSPSQGTQSLNAPHMGALLEGRPVPVETSIGRGGAVFHINLPADSQGTLEVFFFSNDGRYDSAFGKNYHFTLK